MPQLIALIIVIFKSETKNYTNLLSDNFTNTIKLKNFQIINLLSK